MPAAPRRAALALPVLLAVACRDPAPPERAPAPGPDVARGPWELLVERVTRGGARSAYTMALDGSRVLPFPLPAGATGPVPSPNGRAIAYVDAGGGLALVDREGHGRPLLAGAWQVEGITWAPDGGRLVFAGSTLTESDDLWVVNADGTGLRDLTPDPLPATIADRFPSFSPDGARIAFSSNRSGVTRLWTMAADGTGAAPVFSAALETTERGPAWSPDGSLLAFVALGPAPAGVGLVRPDGSERRVFAVRRPVRSVSWSPDGRVIYASDPTGDLELYALDPATGETTNLTRHLDHDLSAAPLRHVPARPWRGLAPPARYAAATARPAAIAAGDVTGDGRADLALVAPAGPSLAVLAGAQGGLERLGALAAPAGAAAVAIADVSRDGVADAVVLGARTLSVRRGGPGGPGSAAEYPLAGDARALAVADLDSDGSSDVVVVHDGAVGFHALVHSASAAGGGLVTILDASVPFAGALGACTADVTGEGSDDLVVLTSDPASAVVLLPGHGDLTFAPAVVAATGLALGAAAAPACADLDGDRRADLVLVDPGDPSGAAVLRSAGAAFGLATPLGVAGTAVAVADLDRDGDLDLIVAGPSRPAVAFLRNLGDGRFAPPVELDAGGAPVRLATLDLDGDGWTDLAVADADGSVALLRNLGPVAP